MMIQPVLLVAVAVSVAGIARRLSGPTAAVLAGCSVAALPTVIEASQSYWYGLGAAAVTAGAVWALLASDCLTNRNRWLYGILLGLMPLARTMALGFVPAVMAAGVVLAWPERRRLVRLAQSWAAGLAVAAPWWIARRHELFDYLANYGYGERAGLWGSGGPLTRTGFRIGRLTEALWWLTPVVAAGAICVSVSLVALRRRGGDRPEGWRAGLAVGLACAAMFAALVSTTNQGVWFELPLVLLLAAVGVAALDLAPRGVRMPLVALMVAMAVVSPVVGFVSDRGHADSALAEYDPRFEPSASADDTRAAVREWAELSETVQRELASLTEHGTTASVFLTGNMFLFNSNSIELSAELDGWAARIRVPDTLGTSDHSASLTPALAGEFRPDGTPKERILVVARHDLQLFTPDLEWPALDQQALEAGWVEHSVYEMPVKGEVAILRHPAAPRGDRRS